jgi:putative zinc finger/helix-turn-helix YgiT family protein
MNCPNNHGEMRVLRMPERLEFRGETINFVGEHFICPVCKIKVDNLTQAAINQKAISDAYRKTVSLLTGAEIIEGRKKLGWTQEHLAKVMNVSVRSGKRWEKGQIQTKVMDNSLRRALRGDGATYDPHTGGRPFSLCRTKLVLNHFGEKLKRDPLPARDRLLYSAKYLWYADMIAYRETGQSMTGATYAALPHGPQLNNYKELVDLIRKSDESEAERLTEQEVRIINKIAKAFPTNRLVYEAAHKENVWQDKPVGSLIPYTEADRIMGIR